jgi:hypothetical protein
MIAALAAITVAIVTLSVSGLLIGWQIDGSLPQALAGYGLLLAFAFTMLWIGALIGVMVRSPDAVLGIGFLRRRANCSATRPRSRTLPPGRSPTRWRARSPGARRCWPSLCR